MRRQPPCSPPEGRSDRLPDVREAAALLADPAHVSALPVGAIPAVLGVVESLRASLWSRLVSHAEGSGQSREADGQDDALLTAREAATVLGMSPHWLYKNAGRLPFTRRLGPRTLRFSASGIRRYLARHAGS